MRQDDADTVRALLGARANASAPAWDPPLLAALDCHGDAVLHILPQLLGARGDMQAVDAQGRCAGRGLLQSNLRSGSQRCGCKCYR